MLIFFFFFVYKALLILFYFFVYKALCCCGLFRLVTRDISRLIDDIIVMSAKPTGNFIFYHDFLSIPFSIYITILSRNFQNIAHVFALVSTPFFYIGRFLNIYIFIFYRSWANEEETCLLVYRRHRSSFLSFSKKKGPR